MAERTVKIDNLHLDVPHMNADQAGRLAHEVTQHLAVSLPAQLESRDLSLLKLNVRVPKGADQSRISVLAAQAIIQAIS